MKKRIVHIMLVLVLLTGCATPTKIQVQTPAQAIHTLLSEAVQISGIPGMSVAICNKGEVFYFSAGYADREKRLRAGENTLYELASLSKAFTGMGMLLLEAQGKLSMSDPIQKYLPWLTFKYKGKPVDMDKVTLYHFLYHTSGLTNGRHSRLIPQGDGPEMLKKTVESLVNADLSFSPNAKYNTDANISKQIESQNHQRSSGDLKEDECIFQRNLFEYGTVNYDVLGLVIEVVSGQRYERFMEEQICQPLGLHNTYLYHEQAQTTGQLAQGYRTSFGVTFPYDAPVYGGNKPAGYIISNSKDMARWMGIQLGMVQDIPAIFQGVIQKSHRGDMAVPAVNGMFYGAGWFIDAGQSILEHPGGNPNFATEIQLWTKEGLGICLLTNGANTNRDLVLKIKSILAGNGSQTYERSGMQWLDIMMTAGTFLFGSLALLFFCLGFRRKKGMMRNTRTKRCLRMICFIGMMGAVCSFCSMFVIWQPYSVMTAVASFVLFVWVVWDSTH